MFHLVAHLFTGRFMPDKSGKTNSCRGISALRAIPIMYIRDRVKGMLKTCVGPLISNCDLFYEGDE